MMKVTNQINSRTIVFLCQYIPLHIFCAIWNYAHGITDNTDIINTEKEQGRKAIFATRYYCPYLQASFGQTCMPRFDCKSSTVQDSQCFFRKPWMARCWSTWITWITFFRKRKRGENILLEYIKMRSHHRWRRGEARFRRRGGVCETKQSERHGSISESSYLSLSPPLSFFTYFYWDFFLFYHCAPLQC